MPGKRVGDKAMNYGKAAEIRIRKATAVIKRINQEIKEL
jgi:hypothetical protein